MAKAGEISVDHAKLLVNAIGHQSLATIYDEASKLASAKNTAGIKAVGNAGADSVVSLFTLGQMNANLFEVTKYDRAVGYDISYGAARVATELGTGLATGGLSVVSKIGKGLLVLDAAGNALVAGQGVADMAECGVTWQNSLQVGGGVFGVGGNAAGVFGRNMRFGGRAGVENGRAASVPIEMGKQGKHIIGHNNYIPGRSPFSHPDPQSLINRFAGRGQPVGSVRRGQPGFKERVDFGEVIGFHDGNPTTKGIIHYSKTGAHIVPARP